ncbi:MAG: protein kinase [Verrucomicrobiae bacterium]|nr:protein kinase [Verrucomicrobiae bacterium]
MNAEQKRLAREIFADALEKDDLRERAAFVAQACGADAELRELVEALLQAHEAGGELPGQALLTAFEQPLGEAPDTMIGRYKLLEQIGEGGFGVVFMAEQTEPVHRKVALKIIKAGMDTKEVIARFEAERQALALMDHPNIAKILDAGITGGGESQISDLKSQIHPGRPYFVMELVKGIPLTDYCDQTQLSTHDRLQLFLQVCQAVQHAHQKGIIHRDLKPSNILVTEIDGKPVPKIIDFGVAKALGQRLTERTLFTAFAQMVGTPAYMSPEQAALSGVDIDTRSDIYALGVLLYELLTGVTPFDQETLSRSALDEVRRQIREVEPPKPSTRLRTLGEKLTEVAQQRQTEPATLTRLVQGDLDWIVMKCLEKDRARRYETASALAEDLRHHLQHEPVKAGPPGTVYRARKFARRHRMGVALAGSVTLALIAGLIVSLIGFREARQERDHAVAAETEAEKQQARAEQMALKEAVQRQRAEQLLRRMEIQQAQELFGSDKASEGLANLALLVRQNPKDLALTEWLVNEMTQRSFPLPVLETLLHDDDVFFAEFSPDARRILTVTRNSSARLWNALTGEPLFAPMQHEQNLADKSKFTGGLFPMFAVFSPDGLQVATGASDNAARIWDTHTGQPLTPPLGHSNWVTALAFSPDGRWLATGCKDGTVRLWNSTNGQPAAVTKPHSEWVNFIEFSPDGKRLLTGSDDSTARVWDVASGLPKGQPMPHGSSVKHGSFSFDGRRVATASADKTARLWDAQTGAPLGPPLRHEAIVVTANFSPDGTRLATASFDHTGRLWDGFTGQPLAKPLRHNSFVRSARFSPEGERVVTASSDGTARVWDAATGEPLGEPMTHHGAVWRAEFSPDGRRVVTASTDCTVQAWDVQAGQPLHHWFEDAAAFRQAAWSPDGQRVLTISTAIRMWDALSSSLLPSPIQYRCGPGGMTGRFSPDGTRFVTASTDGTARIWRVADGGLAARPVKHLAAVHTAEFSPDSLRIVTASDDGTARVWDARTGEPLGPAMSHSGAVLSARFSPNGRQVLTAGASAQACLWDWQTGQPLAPPLSHPASVMFADFSPDGRWALTICTDHAVRVWSLPDGHLLGTPIRHQARVASASFSPDGRWIVTGSIDYSARVWEARSGTPVSEPLWHAAAIVAAEFSPDGRFVLTASDDRTARLWDAATGLPIHAFRHNQRLSSAHFSPDGGRILTVPLDRTCQIGEIVRVPRPAPEWLPDLAEAVAGQRITSNRILEDVPAGSFLQWRRKIAQLPDTDALSQWAKWFCADRFSRSASPSSSRDRATFVQHLVKKSYSSWDPEQALGNLRAALKLDPLNPDAYAAWVFQVTSSGRTNTPKQLAQLDWQTRRFAALSTDEYRAGMSRAEYLAETGDFEGALALMETAASHLTDPPNVDYWIARAKVLERAGRNEQALGDYNQAVEALEAVAQGVWQYDARWQRYRFLCQQGRYTEAQADRLKLMHIPPRDPRTPVELIDLSPFYNASLTGHWLAEDLYRADLRPLPKGLVNLDGVSFDVRALIQLRDTNTMNPHLRLNPFPGFIPLSRTCRQLHFLHAADLPDAPGQEIGCYVIRYGGGETERIPIIYGKAVSSWLLDSPEPGAPKPAWQSLWLPGVTLQLYHTIWTNSHPDRRIESLGFAASANAKAAPFLVALTVEP